MTRPNAAPPRQQLLRAAHVPSAHHTYTSLLQPNWRLHRVFLQVPFKKVSVVARAFAHEPIAVRS